MERSQEKHREYLHHCQQLCKRDFAQVEKTAAILAMGGAQFYIPGKNIGEEKRFKEEGGLVWSEAGLLRYLILNGSMEMLLL
jgi:hypothetical protein